MLLKWTLNAFKTEKKTCHTFQFVRCSVSECAPPVTSYHLLWSWCYSVTSILALSVLLLMIGIPPQFPLSYIKAKIQLHCTSLPKPSLWFMSYARRLNVETNTKPNVH